MDVKTLCAVQNVNYRLQLPPVYQGDVSTVYKASDLNLNRTVAVKEVLLRGLDKKDQSALRSEVNSCIQCAVWSDHIPQIYNRFEHDGNLFLVMQWVEGSSLRTVLENGDLRYNDKLDLAIQLCQILAPLHHHHFQHRDLRPENLQIVKRRGAPRQLWLLDFNLAAAVPRLNRGTPGYLAPELTGLSQQPDSSRVDVFAIGVILYEMFANVIPLFGQDYYNVPGDTAWTQFTPPSAHDPKLSPQLDRIVAKCMLLDLHARYEDAGEIAADLLQLRKSKTDRHSARREKGGK